MGGLTQEQEGEALDLDGMTVLLAQYSEDPFQEVGERLMGVEDELVVVGPDEWLED